MTQTWKGTLQHQIIMLLLVEYKSMIRLVAELPVHKLLSQLPPNITSKSTSFGIIAQLILLHLDYACLAELVMDYFMNYQYCSSIAGFRPISKYRITQLAPISLQLTYQYTCYTESKEHNGLLSKKMLAYLQMSARRGSVQRCPQLAVSRVNISTMFKQQKQHWLTIINTALM